MKSAWEAKKPLAIELREQGSSIKQIYGELGIPLSTLSGWLKDVSITQEQKERLKEQGDEGLIKARIEAVKWHNAQKAERIASAEQYAASVLENIPVIDTTFLELALAFLYLGEGSKNGQTSLGSSNPQIARFYVDSIRRLYEVPDEKIKAYLHLRADQDDATSKEYWANILNLPLANFGKTSFDKRTSGKATYEGYKGVCIIECGKVEIQRRLMYIATGYCNKVASYK